MLKRFQFDFSNLDTLSNYFRKELNSYKDSDRIFFPKEIGEGYLSYYKITDQVFLLINNYKAHCDIEYLRVPIEERDIILHFRKYALHHKIDKDEIISTYEAGYTPGNMRCVHARYGESVFVPKGAEVKSVMIVIKQDFLKEYYKKPEAHRLIDEYIQYTHEHIDKFYLSYKQATLFDQIVHPNLNKVENYLYYTARGIILLETFWKDALRWRTSEDPFNVNTLQVEYIYKVSTYLKNHLESPFIGVDKLAAMANMSRTSFFNMFREIHNETPLEFFNNRKLESSYNMIFVERKSIKEVMDRLNYSNSSKFKKAFFNKFNIYPNVEN
ncbi:helix-turn-helix domain-containing protein [Aquimarina rhabdastrellae]